GDDAEAGSGLREIAASDSGPGPAIHPQPAGDVEPARPARARQHGDEERTDRLLQGCADPVRRRRAPVPETYHSTQRPEIAVQSRLDRVFARVSSPIPAPNPAATNARIAASIATRRNPERKDWCTAVCNTARCCGSICTLSS